MCHIGRLVIAEHQSLPCLSSRAPPGPRRYHMTCQISTRVTLAIFAISLRPLRAGLAYDDAIFRHDGHRHSCRKALPKDIASRQYGWRHIIQAPTFAPFPSSPHWRRRITSLGRAFDHRRHAGAPIFAHCNTMKEPPVFHTCFLISAASSLHAQSIYIAHARSFNSN